MNYKYPQDDIPMGDKFQTQKSTWDLVAKNIAKEQFYNLLIGNIDDLELKAIAIGLIWKDAKSYTGECFSGITIC